VGDAVELKGWVRTVRNQKQFAFMQVGARAFDRGSGGGSRPRGRLLQQQTVDARTFQGRSARHCPVIYPTPATLPAPRRARSNQVNDGSNLSGIQVVLEPGTPGFDLVESGALTTGASVRVAGALSASPGAKQAVEIKAKAVELVRRALRASAGAVCQAHSLGGTGPPAAAGGGRPVFAGRSGA
jgi:hypothetical protein